MDAQVTAGVLAGLTSFAGAGLGVWATSRQSARKEVWELITKAEQDLQSADVKQAKIGFDHLYDLLQDKKVNNRQRRWIRTNTSAFLAAQRRGSVDQP